VSRVLLIGESWFIHSIHRKGFDSFTTSEYTEGGVEFCAALAAAGHDVERVPAHRIPERIPCASDGYDDVDVVVISDVGANSFLLGPSVFRSSRSEPNRLTALAEWVRAGGGLMMVGGYMSFAGIDGKAVYGSSPLASVLPVRVSQFDDRVQAPEGSAPRCRGDHPVCSGLGGAWPNVLGYNRVAPAPGGQVLAWCGPDPLLVVGQVEAGWVVAFTSDLAPHWAPPEFLSWSGYPRLWANAVRWLAANPAA